METCFNYCEPKKGFFSSDERKWISYMRKLNSRYPDEVIILRQPEDNDGCIYVQLPPSYMRFYGKRQSNMTEEQRKAASERMKALVNSRRKD